LDTIVPDKLPPHIRAQIEDFKRKATHNEALSNEYRSYYEKHHTPNQPTYEQWLKDNGKQRMAKGGITKEQRQANLDKFLEGSQAPHKVYHATTGDFKKFMMSKAGKNTKHPTSKLGVFSAEKPSSTEDFIKHRYRKNDYEQGANVMPLHMSIKKPVEIPSSQFVLQSMALERMKKKDADKYIQDFMDQARSEGHDGAVIRANPRGLAGGDEFTSDNWVAFDPRQVKSAIGNRGTYDPNEHDITKADGGDVSIQDMRNYILQREGTHGAKRLERAADEIPNLEKMYSPQALKEAFSGDNTRVVATINPKDFERYATPLPMDLAMNKAYHSDKAVKPTMRQAFMDSGLTDQQWQELNDYQRADLFDKYDAKISKMKSNRPMSYDQYIKHLAKIKGGFAQVPFLQLDKQEQGLPIVPHITGHEGRHRNRALFHKGVDKSLVTLEPRAELREGFPRRERGEYLDALKKEMAMTNNMVRPEDEEEYGKSQIIRHRRSPIQLPDFYAEGGDVQGKPMNTPTLAQMRHSINTHGNPEIMDNIGINEAMDMDPKIFVSPNPHDKGIPATGGVADSRGLPIGGVDTNSQQPGQQLNPMAPAQPGQQPGQPPEGMGSAPPPSGPTPPEGNMLSMTPQGQTMQAMQPNPQAMADGGQPKRMFKIQTAGQHEARKEPEFTPYEPKDISIKKLARAFDEAIAHHRSLPNEERIANSHAAAQKLGKIIGVNPNGMTKDLLGKNAKLLKTEQGKVEELKLPDGRGVETTGLALAPAYEEEGFTTCPNSASCKKECLGKTSGNYHKLGGGADLSEFKGPRLNSLKKTQAFLHDPHSFAVRLHDEIQAAKEMAGANNNHLGVRLNVLSDINPRVHKSIIEAHPDVTFYDYTKNNTNPIAPNHHYTYSSTGVSQEGVENPNTNWKQMRKRLQGGDNVAMAFSHKAHIPETVHDEETGQKFRVINGDTHDFRPMDLQPEGKHGVIVGLKNKKATGRMNEAHIDSQGFFVHHDPQEKMVLNKSGKPIFARDAKGKTIAQNKEVRIKPQYDEMKVATNDDGDKV
jgi:hypothetical protein